MDGAGDAFIAGSLAGKLVRELDAHGEDVLDLGDVGGNRVASIVVDVAGNAIGAARTIEVCR